MHPIKRALRAAAVLSLTGLAVAACATTSPATPGTITPADRPQCPPGLTAATAPQPRLPDGATIPRPITEADAQGLDLTLQHVATLASWGREGWQRAEEARRWCEGQEQGR